MQLAGLEKTLLQTLATSTGNILENTAGGILRSSTRQTFILLILLLLLLLLLPSPYTPCVCMIIQPKGTRQITLRTRFECMFSMTRLHGADQLARRDQGQGHHGQGVARGRGFLQNNYSTDVEPLKRVRASV